MPERPHQLQMSTEALVQDGRTGAGLVQQRVLQPLWGRLTKEGPESSPNFYEWEPVYRETVHDKWQSLSDIRQGVTGSYLVASKAFPYAALLLEPAVEVNDKAVPIDSVVRLYPQDLMVDLEGNKHRQWMFAWESDGLRPFRLAADLIPGRATGPGDNTPIFDETIAAEWLDDPGEFVQLFSAHLSGWPAGDSFISLGYGRGPSGVSRGTYGWAQFQRKGTIIGLDAAGDPIWRPEWQIVELYAELTQEMQVTGSNVIEHGKLGQVALFWPTGAAGEVTDSGYVLVFYNDLFVDVAPDDFIQCRYDRYTHRWIAFGYPVPTGTSIYQSAGQTSTSSFAVLQTGTDVTDAEFGLHIKRDGNTIKNESEREIRGVASWQVCAQRRLNPLPVDADAILLFALYNDGVQVTGTEGRLSSSRRLALNEGNRSVNTGGGSVHVTIDAGEAIDLRIRHSLNADSNDVFVTVPDASHLTFHEIQGAAEITP